MYDIPLKLVLFLLVGMFAGHYLDNILNFKEPFLAVTCAFLGLAGGIWACLKNTLK